MADEKSGLVKRLGELAARAAHKSMVTYSEFLDPAELIFARAEAARNRVNIAVFGGYEDAERCVAAFYPEYEEAPQEWPFKAVRLSWNARFSQRSHRDIMGAILALGINREAMGDILPMQAQAWVFMLEPMAVYVKTSLEQVGRASVKVEMGEIDEVEAPPKQYKELVITVASARLDAMVAAIYAISRPQAVQAINRELVKVNHLPVHRTDAHLAQGDLISLKGHGRAVIAEVGRSTKSGRERYIIHKLT